jgi:hypothetical protein
VRGLEKVDHGYEDFDKVIDIQSILEPHDECRQADQIKDERTRNSFREILADIEKDSAP